MELNTLFAPGSGVLPSCGISQGGACCSTSQVSFPGQSCPTPCQGDGLKVNWSSVSLLFLGGFPHLFRGSEQKQPCQDLWPRGTRSQFPFFNKPSRSNYLHICVYQAHRLLQFTPTTLLLGGASGAHEQHFALCLCNCKWL